jgi:hypothetical protein
MECPISQRHIHVKNPRYGQERIGNLVAQGLHRLQCVFSEHGIRVGGRHRKWRKHAG